MQTKPLYKIPLFWLSLILVLVTGALVFLVVLLSSSQIPPAPPATTTAAITTQQTTVPTTAETTVETTVEETLLPVNPFGPNDFQFSGDYLTCLTAPSVLGIDVSSYQGIIDWQAVKGAGVEFAIIRVGGRGYGEKGVLYDDDYAQDNYRNAKAAGLSIGAYFFSQATTIEEAQEEARYILEKTADWELDMPIVYDWEYISEDARTANVDPETLTACCRAFCETILAAEKEAMIYFNPRQSEKRFYVDQLQDFPFWLAMYSDRMTYPHRVDMWQYTNVGKVPGIQGDVDINLFFPRE